MKSLGSGVPWKTILKLFSNVTARVCFRLAHLFDFDTHSLHQLSKPLDFPLFLWNESRESSRRHFVHLTTVSKELLFTHWDTRLSHQYCQSVALP